MVSALEAAAAEAWNTPNANTGAWACRRCFDAILDGSIASDIGDENGAPSWAKDGEVTVLEFSSSPNSLIVPAWRSMDDQVMGGLSSSSMSWNAAIGSGRYMLLW